MFSSLLQAETSHRCHDGKFWLGGSSYLGPPMPLLEKLSRMHPNLVFTAHSTLEHVSYERWRVVDGVAEQLETFNKNLLTSQVCDHWIKDGEESVLDKYDDPELLRLEEAAQAIVSKSASPLWTENTLEQMTGLPMDREAREARKAENKARTDELLRQWMETGEIPKSS